MNCVDCMIILCWFQQIKQVKTLSSFVKKYMHYEWLLNELGFTSAFGNPTYTRTNLTNLRMKFFKIIFCLNTLNFPKNQYQFELPHLYWIPIMHKNPHKDTLMVPVNALLSLYLYYLLNFKQLSKSHFIRDTVPLHIPEVVSIRCEFSKTPKNYYKI
jgi:hypothetical protein